MSSSSLSMPRRIEPTERDRTGRDASSSPSPSPKDERDSRGRSPDAIPETEPDAPRDPRTEPRTLLAGAHDGLSPLGPNERDDDDEDR